MLCSLCYTYIPPKMADVANRTLPDCKSKTKGFFLVIIPSQVVPQSLVLVGPWRPKLKANICTYKHYVH